MPEAALTSSSSLILIFYTLLKFVILKRMKEEFQKAYDFLNKEQKLAVDTLEGAVAVNAGPGTGKTQILTLRIANILKEKGLDFAEHILALTFTNSGVYAMQKRLSDFVGVSAAYDVGIYTFHSFCDFQIKNNPEFFPAFAFSKPLSDVEALQIIDEILEDNDFQVIRSFGSIYHNSPKILSAVSELKQEGISPEDFEKTLPKIPERVIASCESPYYKRKTKGFEVGDLKPEVTEKIKKEKAKQEELCRLYKIYQKKLDEKKLYDFSDMILSVLSAVKENAKFRESLQRKYKYILLDEHQDTNSAQNALVESIAQNPRERSRSPNIFTVGDKKQAIYGFQGASVEEFDKFKKKYDVKEIDLVYNYRSSQNILDAADSLLPQKKKLKAGNEKVASLSEKPKIVSFETRKSELIFIAESIKEQIKKGIDINEIAVFYRKNKEVEEIKDILDKFKIKYTVLSKEDILQSSEIQKLILLLKAIENPLNNHNLAKALFVDFLSFKASDILKILNLFNTRKPALKIKDKSVFKIISDSTILDKIFVERKEDFTAFAHFLEKAKSESENKSFSDFLHNFLNEKIGEKTFLEYILSLKDSVTAFANLNRIIGEVETMAFDKKNYSLSDFLKYIDTLEKHGLKLERAGNNLADGVRLMTAHASKGLEFDCVYITNFVKSVWDTDRSSGISFLLPVSKKPTSHEDRKRLFYVALTRGKKDIFITYSKSNETLKRETLPSVFLDEINRDFFEEKEGEEKDYLEKQRIYFRKKEERLLSFFDKEYIKKLFLEKALSFSALSAYKKSPILYFFRYLLPIPQKPSKTLLFGNIIHKSLENFFAKKGSEEITKVFRETLKTFDIPEKDFFEIQKRGEKVLREYFEKYKGSFDFDVLLENQITAFFTSSDGYKIKLYGVVDKMEKKDGGKIRVVDYKTGKTYFEKKKEEKESLLEQMLFYKILIDEKYGQDRVDEGLLDFIEPSGKTGEFVRQSFVLDKVGVGKVKEDIDFMCRDIISGDFLDRKYERTSENEEYFDLWRLLKKTSSD